MKIVFISTDTSLFTGKNADVLARHREYANYFKELYLIVFSLKLAGFSRIDAENLHIIPTNSLSRWHYLGDSLKILTALPRLDIISTQDPFICALVGVLAKFRWGVKLNIQIHNDYFKTPYFRRESLQNYLFYWLGRLTLLSADSVRVVSKRLGYGHKSFVAPVPVDLDYFWSKPHVKRFNQIVTVARLIKQKNIPLLIGVAERVCKTYPKMKFVVVGEGEERPKLEGLISEKGLEGKVLLVGQKNRLEVKQTLAKSDIFLLTSNYEGWGLSAIEALAAGLPVVMTDTGCAGEVVNNRIGGYVCKQGNIKQIFNAIKSLERNRNEIKNLVMEGQKKLKESYSQNKLVAAIVDNLQ